MEIGVVVVYEVVESIAQFDEKHKNQNMAFSVPVLHEISCANPAQSAQYPIPIGR